MSLELFTTSRGSLETRLFSPPNRAEDDPIKSLAVFLHPWAPLGGNMLDPVLHSLKPVFLSRNCHILFYNSRPSFTGVSEGQDLRELVEGTIVKLGRNVDHLIIMGYSHGSLIASLHPVLPETIKTSHILLSYPMSVRGLITFFRGSTFESALHSLVQNPRSNILAVYGDQDQFTSIQKYELWADRLNKDARGRLSTIKVNGADHFWHGPAAEAMCTIVGRWLEEL